MDKAGDAAAQVEQGLQFDGGLGRAKRRPGKYRQAQVDGGGIQGVDRVGEFHLQRIAGVESAGLGNQALRQLGVDAPVAPLVGIGQGGVADGLAESRVVESRCLRRQTHFDIAQTLPVGQLRESQAAELLGTGERTNSMVAAVPPDDAVESLPRQKLHDLREQRLADVHASLRPDESRKGAGRACRRSSRGQLANVWNPRRYWISDRSYRC